MTSSFLFNRFLLLCFTTLLISCNNNSLDKKDTQVQSEEIKYKKILPNEEGDEMERIIYSGSASMNGYKGTAKCIIFNNTGITEFDQDYGDVGSGSQNGKIIMTTATTGRFQCSNGSCDYDVHIDKSRMVIKGANWKCDLKRVGNVASQSQNEHQTNVNNSTTSFDNTLKKLKDLSKYNWGIYDKLSNEVDNYYGSFKFISNDEIEFNVGCGKNGDVATCRLVETKPSGTGIKLQIENPDFYLTGTNDVSYIKEAGSLKIVNDTLILAEYLMNINGDEQVTCGGQGENIFRIIRRN